MKMEVGNIWHHHDNELGWLVITTNIGWKSNGANPMGRGIALDAARRYPRLPFAYGALCKKHGANTPVTPWNEGRLYLFPTKPLNEAAPYASWKGDSSIELIKKSLVQLVALVKEREDKLPYKENQKIYLPLVGCGNGNLPHKEVFNLLKKTLSDRYTLVLDEFSAEKLETELSTTV